MKKATMFAALTCAVFMTAGIASAQLNAFSRTSGPVAGFSPNFADPQPNTSATLTENANRLIRWQGWLDVDAFSASILEQMQKQVGNGIEVGKFTMAEPAIYDEVVKAEKAVKGFKMNENLNEGRGEELSNVKLFVWTYRHNYTDTGLYQMYVSVTGDINIGKGYGEDPGRIRHRDIQSLRYEFGQDGETKSLVPVDIKKNVEIWRGAVVRVDAKGVLKLVGNEAGAVVGPQKDEAVEAAPIANWENAPSLVGNPIYKPENATGPDVASPLDRELKIDSNEVQKNITQPIRVRTVSPFRYRNR